MKKQFSGGIRFPHEQENKEMTARLPLEDFSPPRLMIPVDQGIGSQGEPIVTVGDHVDAGQKIAEPKDEHSVPVHCGVSGTVLSVRSIPTPLGETLCVEVENDFQNTPAPLLKSERNPRHLMREAGLVGMGGAGFPTFLKYCTSRSIQTVLINGCECEPYLTSDHHIMLQYPEKVVSGALALAHSIGAAPIICVEDNKPDAIKALQDAAQGKSVTIVPLPSLYPQGGERQLIQAVLGKEVKAGQFPADVNTLVSNVATAVAMADAQNGHPLTHRIITVAGSVKKPKVLRVPIGTLLEDVFKFCGGYNMVSDSDQTRIVVGGPMTGKRIEQLQIPIIKTTSGLIVLHGTIPEEDACIHCGACARVCPSRLMPFAIDANAIIGNAGACEDYHAEQCISCGCCSYICPAKRYLAARVSMAGLGIRKRRAAAQKGAST